MHTEKSSSDPADRTRRASRVSGPHLFAIALTLSGLAACDRPGSDSASPVVRDSAGVRIIESATPVWRDGEGWRLSAEPVVEIGTTAGDETMQLYLAQSPTKLADGRMALANMGTHQVRIYTPDGRHVRSIGREGAGPGEFRSPRKVYAMHGDTLIVEDLDRVSVFDSSGAFLRSETRVGSARAFFSDGTKLWLPWAPGEAAFLLGYSRPDVALVRSSLDGKRADTLAIVSGGELYRISFDDRAISSYSSPFGMTRHVAVHRDSVYTGDGSSFEVRVLDGEGRLNRILRRRGERRPVDAAAIRALEEQMLSRTRNDAQRQRLHRLFSEWTYPAGQPAYDQLLVDRVGNVWVRHFSVAPGELAEWSVFEPGGAWLGVVEVPAALRVEEVGGDYLLAVYVDDLDVEYVRVYAISK